MPQISAGLLMYRRRGGILQVLLGHPGGPFWAQRDEGAWSIPKGGTHPEEELLETAIREFEEETGLRPGGPFLQLSPIRQKGGKFVHAWAVEGDLDPASIRSNTFSIEWPPGSGRMGEFPELDRAEFFGIAEARRKANPAQVQLIEELVLALEE